MRLGVVFIACAIAGCASSPGFRGSIEFGALRVLSEVEVLPQPAFAPDVSYPEVLLAEGIEGVAEVSFVVGSDGAPREITIVSASDPAFGVATTDAVRRLRYVPARRAGQRVPCGLAQTFFFRIQ